MRTVLAVSAIVLVFTPAVAHDFWIQPERFVLEQPGPVPVSLFVGHGQDRSRWGVRNSHIERFETHGPDGAVDWRPSLSLGAGSNDANVWLGLPGTYVFGLHSRLSQSTLAADRFNAYVEKEGITPIARFRERNALSGTEGREVYSRRAKAIVQVGEIDANSIVRVTTPVGLRLEMVPGRHPGTLAPGDAMPIQVFYEGVPLKGALVKLNDLAADEEPVAMQRTDADGRTIFTIPRTANWQLNTIWAEPFDDKERADFDTTFSSLTFTSGR